jgi:predicted transcriptional regulator
MATPDLSRFELECLRRLWTRGEASVRDIHADLPDPPTYSTVRKIVERLEEKGAVERVRRDGRAWVYRSTVKPAVIIRKEIRRLLGGLFDGRGAALVAHLVDMDAISLADLRAAELQLKTGGGQRPARRPPRRRRREP